MRVLRFAFGLAFSPFLLVIGGTWDLLDLTQPPAERTHCLRSLWEVFFAKWDAEGNL